MAVKLLVTFRADDDDMSRLSSLSDALVVARSESREQAMELVRDAEIVFAGHFSDELWKNAPRLKWVQSGGAGIERFMTPDFIASPIVLTNAAGVYAIPIADHVVAFVLHFSRCFNRLVRNQIEHRWDEDREPDELMGKTLGIVGLGGIGSEVARRAKAFGMYVIATRRRPEMPSGFADEVRGSDELGWLLAESDYVALCSALTQNTRKLIGEEELRKMRPTSYLMNIGRGGLIDEPALIAALQESRIAGAGLDVFAEEPLPTDSPLWDMPNVLVTPHSSGSSPKSHQRLMDLFCANVRRYLAGEELVNVVDKGEGY
jgi:phosphoglycerate dehydrogenase-like enzyme